MGMLDNIKSLALKFQGHKINNAKVSALDCESITMITHYLFLMKPPYYSNRCLKTWKVKFLTKKCTRRLKSRAALHLVRVAVNDCQIL
jgi:hypothetical protein